MKQHGVEESSAQHTAAVLLRWFERERRALPWRDRRDPYSILVSEIMLQQTRVETVLRYYEPFLKRFPSVQDLAAARVETVLAAWSGLGYYRRARQLHAAARTIVARGGEFPRSLADLQRLPGVGPYTAAALASIAFGLCEPALDGNAERVISRLFGIGGAPRRAAARKRLEAKARALLHRERPGDSNQALMELGATLCRPRRPRCPRCPLQGVCVAAVTGAQERYPTRRRRPATVHARLLVALVREGERILLFRRPDDSPLLAGLWELPWIERVEDCRSEDAFSRRYGGRWRLGDSHGRVRHAITHRSFEVEVREARLDGGLKVAEGPEGGCFDGARLRDLPLSSLVWKVLAKADFDAR